MKYLHNLLGKLNCRLAELYYFGLSGQIHLVVNRVCFHVTYFMSCYTSLNKLKKNGVLIYSFLYVNVLTVIRVPSTFQSFRMVNLSNLIKMLKREFNIS